MRYQSPSHDHPSTAGSGPSASCVLGDFAYHQGLPYFRELWFIDRWFMLCMSSSLSLAPHFSLYSSSPSSFLSPTPPFLPPPRFLQVLVQEVGVNIDLSFILAVTSLFAQLPSTATEVGPVHSNH